MCTVYDILAHADIRNDRKMRKWSNASLAIEKEKERERMFRILLNQTKGRFSELYSLFTPTTRQSVASYWEDDTH